MEKMINSYVHMFLRIMGMTGTKYGQRSAEADQRSDANANNVASGFSVQAERFIARARATGHHRCADNYLTALNSFMAFIGGTDIEPSKFTSALMLRYQQWLVNRGLCHNTVSCYMRSLRAMYNKLPVSSRKCREDPFRDVYTGIKKTVKHAGREADISRLEMLELEAGSHLALWRDMFLFCFYAMGMPFVDAAHLRRSDIHGDVIEYHRHKTDQLVSVHIESCMRRIIDRYAKAGSPFLFPILDKKKSKTRRSKAGGTDDEYRRYRSALGCYNYALKRLASMAGINGTLSSYVARHTWASVAYSRNVSVNVIAQALGHASPTVTMTYIRDLDRDVVFNANKRIISEIKNVPLRKRCKT